MTLDREGKQIIKIMLKNDAERRRRIRSGKGSEFDTAAVEAIKAAGEKIELPGYAPKQRAELIDKLKTSLAGAVPYEEMGETYCSRTTFYKARKEYRLLIARNMGLTHG